MAVTALHVICISLTQYWCVDCGLVEAVCLRNVTASCIVNNKKPWCDDLGQYNTVSLYTECLLYHHVCLWVIPFNFTWYYYVYLMCCYMFSLLIIIMITLQRFVKKPTTGTSHPDGRQDHAAVLITMGSANPQLLIIGGLGVSGDVLDDAWICDLGRVATWSEVRKAAHQWGIG